MKRGGLNVTIDEIFTVYLTVTTYCQIVGEDFINFCGLLRKRELYLIEHVENIFLFEVQDSFFSFLNF